MNGTLYVAKELYIGLNISLIHIIDENCKEYLVVAKQANRFDRLGAGYINAKSLIVIDETEYSAIEWNNSVMDLYHSQNKQGDLWDRKVL